MIKTIKVIMEFKLMNGGNRMFQSWKFIFLIIISAVSLAACGQSIEEQSVKAVDLAEEAFIANNKVGTDEVDGVKFYKPMSFAIKEISDAQNIIFKTSDQTLTLLINPNEEVNSLLFYEMLLNEQHKEIVEVETFIKDGTFGFAAVIKNNDNQVELIANVGGSKITTLTKDENIAKNLRIMMEVVRSLKK